MKKAIIITAIIALAVGVGGGVWLKTYLDNQNVVGATQGQQPEAPSKYDVGPPDPQEMLELVNRERQKVGVEPLSIDYDVQKSAQLKALDMRDRNYFSHILPGTEDMYTQEMRHLIYNRAGCSDSGENITDNITDQDNTSRQTINNFIASKPHYKAMVSPNYTKIGFGIAGTKNVQHFCQTD